jgi:hypothetical protein
MAFIDLSAVTAADFRAHLGERFEPYAADDVPLALDLVDVVESGDPGRRPFSVIFVGDWSCPDLGLHRLRLAGWGVLDVFLVPIGPGPDGQHRYEAVFG